MESIHFRKLPNYLFYGKLNKWKSDNLKITKFFIEKRKYGNLKKFKTSKIFRSMTTGKDNFPDLTTGVSMPYTDESTAHNNLPDLTTGK
jgi:hypothetical protein